MPFGTTGADGAGIASIVSLDLARSGQFDLLPPESMLSLPTRREQVFFREWRILGVEYVLIGRTWAVGDGELATAYQLFDVFDQRELLSGRLGAPAAKRRDIAHHIADEVFERITGIPGAFSTRILYVLALNAGTSYARYRLEMADSDGERARTLFASDQPLLSASWSPDARQVAYVSFESGRQTIVMQDLVTGKRDRIAEYPGLNGAPVFSPDGDRLALVLSRDGNPEVYVKDLVSRELRRITRCPAIDTEPSWTPDCNGLIFTSDRGGSPQIYQVDLATSMVERLTFQGDYNARARLLPGGEHLLYVHRRKNNDHIAWHALKDADDMRIVTETFPDESPSLAPNGTTLVYATQDGGRGVLAVVSIDRRVRYLLQSAEGDVREPAWSPYVDALLPWGGF